MLLGLGTPYLIHYSYVKDIGTSLIQYNSVVTNNVNEKNYSFGIITDIGISYTQLNFGLYEIGLLFRDLLINLVESGFSEVEVLSNKVNIGLRERERLTQGVYIEKWLSPKLDTVTQLGHKFINLTSQLLELGELTRNRTT